MDTINFKYFKIARKLNQDFHEELKNGKLHFRGNLNSLSLISIDKITAEKGISNIKNEEDAIKLLKSGLDILPPIRTTPEKELQAWIINSAITNNWKLPFGDNITYLTSEIALTIKSKKIVNDILAIDNVGNLCIIELKSKRDNKVKEQTINFEKIVKENEDFFKNLISLISDRKWSGRTRKISVWPKAKGIVRTNKYSDVEEINYVFDRITNKYSFE